MKRVIEGQAAAVRHPEVPGMMIVPDPRVPYRDDDPLVVAYPWMFFSDADLDGEVEQATAAPGEKRSTRRRTA